MSKTVSDPESLYATNNERRKTCANPKVTSQLFMTAEF
ncbi:hypothetical protein CHCC14813_2155 [Bacillus licheniformis]|nr:hypothetical protein CHCC20493_2535 [Bacillus licheniformis]TWK72334.1 hypothetical protein CHCC20339_3528 [Bacillus licheniformis]TWK99191.1 hypothetical protein CHCC20325_2328 [Bacillus licheniformis]TWM68770.1 hypothetical protein CHCC14813_2155 [Bacillus licheniformis]TWM99326.1 hypothetical protein CHCC14566_1504 [Bacillus licheniformis]